MRSSRHLLRCMCVLVLCLQACRAAKDAPPKITKQSDREVWFHMSAGVSTSTKRFLLHCDATGYPMLQYGWIKDGEALKIDGERIRYTRPGQSGTIVFEEPKNCDIGEYQCSATNIFGTALSDIFHVRQGVLEHFVPKPLKTVTVDEGQPYTLSCTAPYGNPRPSLIWVVRNTKQTFVIETVESEHITVDGEGNLQFSHVTPYDGRQDILYQCHATSPVLQGETRAGDETKLVVKKASGFTAQLELQSLSTTPPVEYILEQLVYRRAKVLWNSPEQINVTAGGTLELSCIFSGFPTPHVRWSRISGSLPSDRIKYTDYGKTLRIKPVHPSDQGTYMCSAEDTSHQMTVDVTAAPFWQSNVPPADAVQKENEAATLECNVDADPPLAFQWSLNGKQIVHGGRYDIKENGRILDISHLDHDIDTGVYQCNASNPFGYIFANSYLHVLAHAPRFSTQRQQTIKAVQGSKVELDCSVVAAPNPKVQWLDQHKEKIEMHSRLKLHENNSLVICKAQLSDSGLYKCNVSNKYGINEADRHLTVYYPTKLLRQISDDHAGMEEKVLKANDTVSLQCEAKSDDRLKLQYEWYQDGVAICRDPLDQTYRKVNETRVQIVRVRARHSGVYTCNASTEIDSVVSHMRLIVQDIPEPPDLIGIDCNINTRRATIRWNAPFPNYDPIDKYLVEYKTDFEPRKWKPAVTELDANRPDPFQAVFNLTPWVNYTFRVIAHNSYGNSLPALKESLCRTPPSVPHENPTHVLVKGAKPDNLVIHWKPMHKEQWNGPGFRYRIRYKRVHDPETSWHQFDVENPYANHTVIWDQPTFQKYAVQVLAVNDEGVSLEEGNMWKGYSGEDIPSSAPQDFTLVEHVNSTAVKLRWKHVNPKAVLGHFKGYKIRSWKHKSRITPRADNTDNNSMLQDIILPPNQTEVVVNLFQPMHHYGAAVLVFNEKFEGPLSTVINFFMPEGAPSEVVRLKAKAVGSTSILTTWDAPEQPNGLIRGYYVKFTTSAVIRKSKHDERDHSSPNILWNRNQLLGSTRDDSNGLNLGPKAVEEAFVPPKQTHHLFLEGQPETQYEISVWAETGGGHGATREDYVTTPAATPPSVPELRFTVLDPYSVRVHWMPMEKGISGIGFYANYTPSNQVAWKRSPFIQLPRKDIVLRGLHPLTDYKLYVVSRDIDPDRRDQETPSRVVTFSTSGPHGNASWADVRSEIPTVTTASWFIGIMCGLALAIVALLVVCICTRTKGAKYPVKEKEAERGHRLDDEEEKSFMEYQYGTGIVSKEDL